MKNKKRIDIILKIGLCITTLLFVSLDMLSDRALFSGDDNLWGWLAVLSMLCLFARWIIFAFLHRYRKCKSKDTPQEDQV